MIHRSVLRALRAMAQNPVGAFAVTLALTLALAIVGSLLAVGAVAQRVLSRFDDQLDITVYLADAATAADRQRAASMLAAATGGWPEVISKRQALAEMRRELRELGPVLDDLPENPLRDSLVRPAAALSRGRLDSLAQELRQLPGVVDVDAGGSWLSPAFRLLKLLRVAGLGFIALLSLSTLVLTANTFRLAVHARREEIRILKLVGATDAFVRAPFLIEGLLEGILAGALAAALLAFGFSKLWSPAQQLWGALADLGPRPLPVARSSLALIAGGGLLGLAASGWSVRRFLKV